MSPKRLRIAVLNRTFSPTAGGAERYSIALVEQLAEKHDIHVFAQSIEHQWPGVTYHRVKMPLRRPRWVNQLWFATATWWATRDRSGSGAAGGFDVVHSHENTWHGDIQTVHVLPVKYNLFQGRVGWRSALRWVKVLTSPRLLVYLGLERLRYAAQPGRSVVVTSDSLLSIFNASYPTASAMTTVITPGISLPDGPVSAAVRLDARQKLGLPAERPCVLFIGNDFRKKGLPAMLEALRLLPDDVVLAVVGNALQLSDFGHQISQAGLISRVFFLGTLSDIRLAYRAADCLAHPTLEDTFAMVVLEAMAYSLPVVVSGAAYCGISGLLEDGVNALVLDDPRDVIALSDCLRRVLGDEALKTKLAHAARAFAEKFEWRGIAAAQEKLYYAASAAKAKAEAKAR
jgi:UDP-glucose:(heptosyl)LPS alpha-1,3-glucosyltransferase